MRIALIAPLIERVPPVLYGGTERIVAWLADELVAAGHAVTLFASGDSRTRARLVPCAPRALRLDPTVVDPVPHATLMLEKVRQRADTFDLLHFHIDCLHFPLFRPVASRTLTTLHGRLDLPDLQPFYREFRDMPVVSISDAQRAPLPFAGWAGTVLHGMPDTLLAPPPRPGGRDDLVFLGRISPEKGPERAIEIARRAGLKLKIAAKVDKPDQAYFEQRIRPLLGLPGIEWVGEIGDADKAALLGGARAMLMPIDWPEPFGLVMIEAMACGTPTIAFRRGAVPEILEHGISGLVVDDVDAAVTAVAQAATLDRRQVRARFDARFTARRMAADYLALYARHLAAPNGLPHPSATRALATVGASNDMSSKPPGSEAVA